MDNSLIAQIKRRWIVSIWDFGTLESFIKFIRKDMRIIKCRKVKFGAYQGGQLVFISFDCPFCKLSLSMRTHFKEVSKLFLIYPRVGWSNWSISYGHIWKGKREGEKAWVKGRERERE